MPLDNAGDLFSQDFFDEYAEVYRQSRRFAPLYEPLVWLLARNKRFDGDEATVSIGKITAVTAGHPQPRYDAVSVMGPSLQVEDTAPQRDSGDSNMFPAPVDNPCFLFIRTGDPTVYLEVFGEVLEYGSCPPPPGGAAQSFAPIQSQLNVGGYTQQQLIERLFVQSRQHRIIASQRLTTAVVGDGTFQTLVSITIPGGTLGTANEVRATFISDRTTGAGAYQMRYSYGGAVMATLGASAQFSTLFQMYMSGDGATNAQRGHGFRIGVGNAAGLTAAVDSTADQTLLVQTDAPAGTTITARRIDAKVIEAT